MSNKPLFLDIGPNLSLLLGLPTLSSWVSATRPRKPRRGTFGFNVETKSLEYWDGKSWYAIVMSPL